jgi:hypothetical protein
MGGTKRGFLAPEHPKIQPATRIPKTHITHHRCGRIQDWQSERMRGFESQPITDAAASVN